MQIPEAEAVHPGLDWSAVIAGTLFAAALSFVLFTFGAALGLSFASAPSRGATVWWAIAAAIWFLWVEISSFAAGGYLTGRMRRKLTGLQTHETEVRDVSHGLVMWALAVLIGAMLAASLGLGALRTTAQAAGNAAQTLTETSVDALLRAGPQANPQSQQDPRAEITRLLAKAATGSLTDQDRTYLNTLIAQRTGIPPAEAEARVNDTLAAARRAAEAARKTSVIAAFLLAASLLASAGAAAWGAKLGGSHRDESTAFTFFFGR